MMKAEWGFNPPRNPRTCQRTDLDIELLLEWCKFGWSFCAPDRLQSSVDVEYALRVQGSGIIRCPLKILY
ncbi:hypothetical protein SCLCIDRAFT_1216148, partial [Scleroderma citrinum Foug A]